MDITSPLYPFAILEALCHSNGALEFTPHGLVRSAEQINAEYEKGIEKRRRTDII